MMTTPEPDATAGPLDALNREWDRRKAVEGAHAVFHIRPSQETADRLTRALDAWRVTVGLPTAQSSDGAAALAEAAAWLDNGEMAGIVAYEGPSNRAEVIAAYDEAIEDPAEWLRARAADYRKGGAPDGS